MPINITKGKQDKALKMVLYGVESVGKSTFAANAPDAIIIDIEHGSANLDTDRVEDIHTYDDLMEALRYFYKEDHPYKTIVIDSVEAVEQLCYAKVIKDSEVDSIEKVGGGYGKGYTAASEKFFHILHGLDALWKKGFHIIAIGHAEIKTYINPEGNDYDRFKLRLDKRNEPTLKEWSEANLFMNFETIVRKSEDGFNKTKGKGADFGKRFIYTTRTAAYDAKNRYNLPDKISIPKESPFSAFMEAYTHAKD